MSEFVCQMMLKMTAQPAGHCWELYLKCVGDLARGSATTAADKEVSRDGDGGDVVFMVTAESHLHNFAICQMARYDIRKGSAIVHAKFVQFSDPIFRLSHWFQEIQSLLPLPY